LLPEEAVYGGVGAEGDHKVSRLVAAGGAENGGRPQGVAEEADTLSLGQPLFQEENRIRNGPSLPVSEGDPLPFTLSEGRKIEEEETVPLAGEGKSQLQEGGFPASGIAVPVNGNDCDPPPPGREPPGRESQPLGEEGHSLGAQPPLFGQAWKGGNPEVHPLMDPPVGVNE